MEFWGTILLKRITKGKLRYWTTPLIGICIMILWLNRVFEEVPKLLDNIELHFSENLSYPTKSEQDVFNEWVILISILDNEEEAKQVFDKFKSDYISSNHQVWLNDIFLVRNFNQKREWLIVVDSHHGRSKRIIVKRAVKKLWDFANKDRETMNALGGWLNGVQTVFYSRDDFEDVYGVIAGVEN